MLILICIIIPYSYFSKALFNMLILIIYNLNLKISLLAASSRLRMTKNIEAFRFVVVT